MQSPKMSTSRDTYPNTGSEARPQTDVESMRKRLIELEKTRIFSDEDLAFLLRKSAQTNLKSDIESRVFNRKSRASSERTTSGRTVIRSWAPVAEAEDRPAIGQEDEAAGWKQFTAKTMEARAIQQQPAVHVQAAFDSRRLKRPTRLKRMQNRNFIVTILANIIFIPKQAVSSLVSLVVPSSDRRAC